MFNKTVILSLLCATAGASAMDMAINSLEDARHAVPATRPEQWSPVDISRAVTISHRMLALAQTETAANVVAEFHALATILQTQLAAAPAVEAHQHEVMATIVQRLFMTLARVDPTAPAPARLNNTRRRLFE